MGPQQLTGDIVHWAELGQPDESRPEGRRRGQNASRFYAYNGASARVVGRAWPARLASCAM
ncbi:hypothetical protein ACTMU2_39815 [Cupriavidus basilensis]